MAEEVIAIFDIGKTNKKFFLFDANYNVVHEEVVSFEEVPDDDGFLSEDLPSLVQWIKKTLDQSLRDTRFKVTRINFSTYGASLVNLDKKGNLASPFYNYLKPVSQEIQDEFFEKHGDVLTISKETASPILGMLNSGFQLYWLKKEKPRYYDKVALSLHFPQYISYLFTGKPHSDYTSIGCHTLMWDYTKQDYHDWIYKEGFDKVLAKAVPTDHVESVDFNGNKIAVGVGIHDSSSALLPYLFSVDQPFEVLSTGTWSIGLNPFSSEPLREEELKKDCLNFLGVDGRTVKASRLFLGKQFDESIQKLNEYFDKSADDFKEIKWNPDFQSKRAVLSDLSFDHHFLEPNRFGFINNDRPDYSIFEDFNDAYHHLLDELTDIQAASLLLIADNRIIPQLIIEGGFGNNEIFVELIKRKFPGMHVVVSETTQGSSLGAAMILNQNMNNH